MYCIQWKFQTWEIPIYTTGWADPTNSALWQNSSVFANNLPWWKSQPFVAWASHSAPQNAVTHWSKPGMWKDTNPNSAYEN